MRVQSLGGEDPLEKEMATHSSVLAWRIPWTEEPGGLQSIESKTDTTEATQHAHTHTRFYNLPALSTETAFRTHQVQGFFLFPRIRIPRGQGSQDQFPEVLSKVPSLYKGPHGCSQMKAEIMKK